MSPHPPTRFRWVFCQLETLRQCLPQSVRRTLNELPESLDETYQWLMMEIKRVNQVHAYRMLQCLTVAARPLSVAELAELLTFDFDAAKDGIPKLKSDWRWEDHEQAVLSTCSSLITVVHGSKSPVVQFSHFSVKEFLMSDRLAMSPGDISHYHISFPDAHTVLARACLGVLLRDPDDTKGADPLARYAAEHWVAHAQVEDVASRVRDGMERLFDPDKPYFEAWIQLHNIDPYHFDQGTHPEPGAGPLYYAALCGFHELVEPLVLKYPQCASARGGGRGTALHSASSEGHLQIVRSLLRRGVDVDVRGYTNRTPLSFASESGHHNVVQCLIDHGADVNSHENDHSTPLNWAAYNGHVGVVRMLLKHHADVNTQDDQGRSPLHDAVTGKGNTKGEHSQIIRLLLEHGADVDAKDDDGMTPLHVASWYGQDDIVQLLSESRSRKAQT
ncbi:Ankyrin repeat-containing domain protein [Lactarius tabidus]